MLARFVDGAAVRECGLCGAVFGERAAVASLADDEEARARGVAPGIWPLVRVLERLPGLCVHASGAGDPSAGILPYVELGATAADALTQLENLAKSLHLAAGSLQLPWVVELGYERHLAFVLKPRAPGGSVAAAMVRAAGLDVGVLWRLLERDIELSWWRHAGPEPTG